MIKLLCSERNRKRFLQVVLVCFLASQAAYVAAQEEIRGKILDRRSNEPVVGAVVKLNEGQQGSITDADGNFTVPLRSLPATIHVSFLGYKDQEIDIYEKPVETIIIQLIEDFNALNEVVVIGYGTQKRSELTGSIATISAETLRNSLTSSIDNALQGSNAAGVQVSQVSGQPGGRVSIRIRGGSSIQGGNEPLYVVDGFPFYNNATSVGAISGSSINPLSAVNPGDIESIDILKDASATAIYGSRGANGVVIITTKQGKNGKAKVNYDYSIGIQSLAKKIDLLDAHDFAILRNEALYDAAPAKGEYQYKTPAEIATLGKGTDWQDEAFRSAWAQNHQLSITGGTDKTRYSISGNYFDQEGIVRNTDFKRISIRTNIDSQIYKRLKVGVNLSVARTDAQVAPKIGTIISSTSSFITSLLSMPATATVYDENGGYTLQNPFENNFANPIASLLEQDNRTTGYLILGSAYGEYTIAKDLTLKVLLGANVNNNKEYNYAPSYIYEGGFSDGIAKLGVSNPASWLNENTLSYAKKIDDKHFFNFLAGFTQQQSRTETFFAGSSNYVNDYLTYNNLGSGAVTLSPTSDVEASALLSYLGRINYNFVDKYYLSASLRADGSSRFGTDRKWGYFPSVGAAWTVSNESFFHDTRAVIDNLKIRASYGKTGNQEIGSYQSLATLATANYLFGDNLVTGFRNERLPNQNLSWETTHQTDLGFDISFFKHRLTLTTDVYYKKTIDLLLNVQIPWTTGYPSSLQNYGSVGNKGLEITLNSQNLSGKLKWNTGLNFALNRNKVLEVGSETNYSIFGNYIVKVGEPLGSFYGNITDGILQAGEEAEKGKFTGSTVPKAGDRLYKDISENGSFTVADDKTIMGNAQPDFTFGISNSFEYKGIELSFLFTGSVGNDIYNVNRQSLELFNGQQNAAASASDRWTPTNPSTTIPRAKLDPAPVISNRYVEDGSFIKLKSLNLSYTLPKKIIRKIKIDNVKLYVSGQNLLTFTKYSGYDPEVTSEATTTVNNTISQGTDSGVYPVARSFYAGINITF